MEQAMGPVPAPVDEGRAQRYALPLEVEDKP